MITIKYIRVQAKKDVDEISEEAEYRNIHGEVRTPEYENEARIEDGEEDWGQKLTSALDHKLQSKHQRTDITLSWIHRPETIPLHHPFTKD